MSEQKRLHEPIIKWLESKGVRVLSESERFPVAIKDILSTQNYIFPDIIGVKETTEVVVVEVETNLDKILEVMGKCMLWKTIANYVYVAYPSESFRKFKVLEAFGIGLLSVSADAVSEVIKLLPDDRNSYAPRRVTELYPVNSEKQSELHKQIKRSLDA